MGKRRTQTELARDRREEARLYLQGHIQSEIADELNISQQTVSRDLQAIREQWREERTEMLDEQADQQLARAMELYRHAIKMRDETGNSKWQTRAEAAWDRVDKMLGLSRPDRLALTVEDKNPLSTEERMARIMALVAIANERHLATEEAPLLIEVRDES